MIEDNAILLGYSCYRYALMRSTRAHLQSRAKGPAILPGTAARLNSQALTKGGPPRVSAAHQSPPETDGMERQD